MKNCPDCFPLGCEAANYQLYGSQNYRFIYQEGLGNGSSVIGHG
ncbi:MAG: hypothetical protein VKL59_06445 [Nostocaceae cyanobacterium]|nr:hypothetical protein [Nostocaceae cyanobacterium]